MKIAKKCLALALTGGILLSLTACSDTTWVYDYDGMKIPSGLYIQMTMESTSSAQSHEDVDSEISDLFQQTLEGKSAKQWIIDDARELADQYVAVERKFDEMGLTLTQDDLDEISVTADNVWSYYGDLYEENGVAKSTYTTALTNAKKRDLIFNAYYGEGGLEEVSEADLKAYYEENFVNINVFTVSLNTDEDLTEDEEAENESRRASVDEYITAINNGSKSFNEVRDEFNHTYYSEMFGETHDENSTSTYDSAIVDDEESISYVKKGSTSYPEDVIEAMFNLEADGDAKAIEHEGVYYITKRYSNDNTFEEQKENVLTDMKSEDFNALLDSGAEGLDPIVNTAAVNRYDPQNIKTDV